MEIRMAPTLTSEPSGYMQTLTGYLENIMSSTLLGLPREIKELIYFDALSHIASEILVCPPLPSYPSSLPPLPILSQSNQTPPSSSSDQPLTV